jgi:hypothetical protein
MEGCHQGPARVQAAAAARPPGDAVDATRCEVWVGWSWGRGRQSKKGRDPGADLIW